MRTYSISPAAPVISAGFIGEGHSILEDRNAKRAATLERHFDDVYRVFMKKLSDFALQSKATTEETDKLQALLDELIETRKLLNPL